MIHTGLINSILSDVGITSECKVNYTPSDQVLHPDSTRRRRLETWNYQSILGKLNFVAQNTRPGISMTVHNCPRFCNKPTQLHETAIKRICRYLLLNRDKGIVLMGTSILTWCTSMPISPEHGTKNLPTSATPYYPKLASSLHIVAVRLPGLASFNPKLLFLQLKRNISPLAWLCDNSSHYAESWKK